ncbi:MAG: DNA mismatch endonuclease Vsr [Deltaproteobacteria bacterium]|nr:DNA mismatch endonuclease Vsr [Deltaproteobacteria bacterium]
MKGGRKQLNSVLASNTKYIVSDIYSKEKRSELMSKVRAKNTRPERIVRSWLHKQGYRFRLYRKDLPGKPDIVLPKYKTVIFIHGCFWHRHQGCKKTTTPKTHADLWKEKFQKNIDRDRRNQQELQQLGWKVIIVWQCEIEQGTFSSKIYLK